MKALRMVLAFLIGTCLGAAAGDASVHTATLWLCGATFLVYIRFLFRQELEPEE